MRWKLLILTSLTAAITGFSLVLAVMLGFYGSLEILSNREIPLILTIAFPLAAISFAGFFVYRHTARRRKLQTALAVLLTFFLTVAAFAVVSILTTRRHVNLIRTPQDVK